MKRTYPLSIDDQRTLPTGYDGPVYVWDIDKTYLATAFSSMKGMARIPIEFAIDKRAIPGMPEVLRGLRRGPGPTFACAPLYFVSASPPQLRRVVEHKMLLDGVEHDGITFKDWLGVMRQLSPRRFKEQVGFKLCALLAGRERRPQSTEYLFGDDVERDAEAFHLYARLIGGLLSAGEAEAAMKAAGVHREDRRCVRDLLDRIPPPRGRVARIFIHLENDSPPSRFDRFRELVTPVKGAYQLALALLELGLLDAACARQVGEAVRTGHRPGQDLQALCADAVERGLVSGEKARSAGPGYLTPRE